MSEVRCSPGNGESRRGLSGEQVPGRSPQVPLVRTGIHPGRSGSGEKWPKSKKFWKTSEEAGRIPRGYRFWIMSSSKIYERMAVAGASGKFLRPGGLALTETALSRCSFSPGARILDVGCGSGGTVEWLIRRHGLRAAGVDPSPFLLKHGLAENDRLPLVVGRRRIAALRGFAMGWSLR